MMLPQQLEEIARERINDWAREAQQAQLGHLYAEPPRWRQWTGRILVWTGTWLMRRGTAMVPCECRECVPVANAG